MWKWRKILSTIKELELIILKNIDVSIKKGTLIGIAGPSGSGKSSLAYGTIHSISEFEWNKISNENISSYDLKLMNILM